MKPVESIRSLVDQHGRKIKKLRVSLLDACNYRCFYCMTENPTFMKSSEWLSAEEIQRICSILVGYGLEQIRLTGGEPTLRPDFRDIVDRISKLSISKLGLTTNGSKLLEELEFLKERNCQSINISLDSLDAANFKKITRRGDFEPVYQAIMRANEMGFQVKINTVLMKGVNDHELFDFVDFSAKTGIEVRFLELMKIGPSCQSQEDYLVTAGELIERLSEKEKLQPIDTELDSTSFNFRTGAGAQIGFIASESRPFCGNCSRWRLSANGFLRACLMSSAGVNVRDLAQDDYENELKKMLPLKPYYRIESLKQEMYQIGG